MKATTGRVRLELKGRRFLAIGLMSGTSHDGVSAALVEIDPRRRPVASLRAFGTWPYPKGLRAQLLEAAAGAAVGSPVLSALNFKLGRAFGRAAIRLAQKAQTPLSKLSFVGSHGHTFHHLPPRARSRKEVPSTLQMGEAAVIAAMTGAPVVSDFRPMDVAVGGEGAPLAPLAHLMLFGHRSLGRVVQNIGGIANATYVPAGGGLDDPAAIAFDTGPGVMLIDALAGELTGGRMRMDRGGRIAARGRVSGVLLGDLMRGGYFRRRPPKSTGREEFGGAYFDWVRRAAKAHAVDGADLMATLTALTARSIGAACRCFIMPRGRVDQLILTGGGARNPTLKRMIAADLPELEVLTADQVGVNGDALEAVAFAILAWRMLRGRPGNVPAATGARIPAILGKLTLPPQF